MFGESQKSESEIEGRSAKSARQDRERGRNESATLPYQASRSQQTDFGPAAHRCDSDCLVGQVGSETEAKAEFILNEWP